MLDDPVSAMKARDQTETKSFQCRIWPASVLVPRVVGLGSFRPLILLAARVTAVPGLCAVAAKIDEVDDLPF